MRRILFACLCLVVLSTCARDREDDLRSRLDALFFLGETQHFASSRTCTGAVFRVRVPTLRPEVEIAQSPDAAQLMLRTRGLAAIQIEGYSPHDLVDAFLRTPSGDFGREALSTAAQAAECFEGTEFGSGLRTALTQPGATMVYDAQSDGVMVLDYRIYRLFYVGSDLF